MSEGRKALGPFLDALDGALIDAAASAPDGEATAGIRHLAEVTRSLDTTGEVPRLTTSRDVLPVCRFWDEALHVARRAGVVLAPSLLTLGPALSWTQNPNYRRHPPDPAFLDNYGYAVIVGPSDGPPALAVDPRIALGVLLLGPHTHYPLHHHPAVEVYYTMTPGGEWWRGDGPWRTEPAGTAIHHAPDVPHATRAGAGPLLAIYLWHGDLATHARLGAARSRSSAGRVDGENVQR
ncbi:MAG TPA: dimethylsulfonioproprionate lyase family protein [Candidatus Methylomirabilis sp.]|nr:dimethylsulfonioproprionate lyase family protein [Candidatus Methylomirabilis sp.]